MATTLDRPQRPADPDAPRFVFDGVSWADYEAMLRIVGDRPIRVTYDRGRMELMSPLWQHGSVSYLLGRMIDVLTEELGVVVEGADPVTFRREDIEKGVEPDKCYYLGPNAASVRGKRSLEMGIDPPPDLVIEADIESSSMDRLGIYAALGIPEVWRYAGHLLQLLHLGPDGTYHAEAESRAFPGFTAADAGRFLDSGLTAEKTAWIRSFRAFIRDHLARPHEEPDGPEQP